MNNGFELIRIMPFEDKRGCLKKIVMKSKLMNDIEEVYLLYTNTNNIRGNHYHKETIECFTVISGEAAIALKDLNTGNIEYLTISAEDNLVLKVPVNIVHAFKNQVHQPLIMLAVSSREYNESDNDTFPMSIL